MHASRSLLPRLSCGTAADVIVIPVQPPGRMGTAEIVDVVNEARFTRKSLTAFR